MIAARPPEISGAAEAQQIVGAEPTRTRPSLRVPGERVSLMIDPGNLYCCNRQPLLLQ